MTTRSTTGSVGNVYAHAKSIVAIEVTVIPDDIDSGADEYQLIVNGRIIRRFTNSQAHQFGIIDDSERY